MIANTLPRAGQAGRCSTVRSRQAPNPGRSNASASCALAAAVWLALPIAGEAASTIKSLAAGYDFTVLVKADGTMWSGGHNENGKLGLNAGSWDYEAAFGLFQIGGDHDWVAVATGRYSACAIKADGTLWAWGADDVGQLGDGGSTERHSPVRSGTATNWVAVASGWNSSVGLRADGTVWGWGYNIHGTVGDGSTSDRHSPVQAGTASNWVAVTAGQSHVLALRADGTLWGWGYNYVGQVGDGTESDRHSPVQVGTNSNWISVGAGNYHSLAVRADGTLWSWGGNSYGQLGDGSFNDRTTPGQVGSDTNWIAATGGGRHSLGVKSDGSLWAWGGNGGGQLGLGDGSTRSRPERIGTNGIWSGAAGGDYFSLARKADGTLWAFGNDAYGQLGDGESTAKSSPVQNGMDNKVFYVTAGAAHTAALKSDGTLWTWGRNTYGQLGDGSTTERHQPAQVGTTTTWTKAAAGLNHTLALKADGTLWAWGRNSAGALGDGSATERHAPVPIGGHSNWVSLAAGENYSAAVKSDGSLWTWGANTNGQLGDGTISDKRSPGQVGPGHDWATVTAGDHHAVAVKADGTLWSWGFNASGQLGDGSTSEKHAPTQIGGESNWVAAAAAGDHSAALKANGTLWAWGSNAHGQLGDGTTTERHTPVQVGTNRDWIAVSPGPSHTLGIRSDGTLWAWGDNSNGRLGDGTTTEQRAPVLIGTTNDWVVIAAGAAHSAGVTSDGTLWAWGHNANGELGLGDTSDHLSPATDPNSAITTRYVTPSPQGHGKMVPSYRQMVDYNTSTSFTLIPDGNYHLWAVTGCAGTLVSNVFTTAPVTTNTTVRVTFALDPTVTTALVTNIGPTRATCGGEVTSEGDRPVTERGVCWNLTGSPTITDSRTNSGTRRGVFISYITGLTPGQTYKVRAYASTELTTVYGEERSFTTIMIPPGNALSFNGTNAAVNLGTNNLLALTNGPFTIEAWIKPTLKTNISSILGRKNGGSANPGYAFYINTWNTADGRLKFETQGQTRGTVQPAITWGVWQHLAVTWDAATLRFYVNGIEQAASGAVNLTNGGVSTMLGAFPPNSACFSGQMDEVRIWSRQRGEAELRDDMHQQLSGGESGLLAYYQFNYISGGVLEDLSANAIDGTLTNGPIWTASTLPCAGLLYDQLNLRSAWVACTNSLPSSRVSLGGASVSGDNWAVFGHDDGAETWQITDVPPSDGLGRRLSRVWQSEIRGSVTATIRIDASGLSDVGNGSTLRLLCDTDGTFANGATVLAGSFSAPYFSVPAQSILSGAHYTLAQAIAKVATAELHDITATNALGGGEVLLDGGQPVTVRGLCWNTSGAPTIADSRTADGTGVGAFTSVLSGLVSGETYFVRAYATTVIGTVYGEERLFTTTMAPPGSALGFDGQSNYVQIASTDSLDLMLDFTLECWFKADTLAGSGTLRGLISKYQSSGANGFLLRLNGTDLEFDQAKTSSLGLQTNRWYHVAAVSSNRTHSLYVNGNPVTLKGTPLSVTNNTNPIRLGSDFGGRFFAGQMDEVRIWSVVRSSAEIRDAMHRQVTGSEAGLAAYYLCNAVSGTNLLDRTTNHNSATLVDGTAWVPSTVPCAQEIAERNNLRAAWITCTNSLASDRLSLTNTTVTGTDCVLVGHDGGPAAWQTDDVPPGSAVARRLGRIWQAEVHGNATGTIVIETAGLSDLYDDAALHLLVSSNGTFAQATRITGTLVGSSFIVPGQALTHGAWYTLGNDSLFAEVTNTSIPGLAHSSIAWGDFDNDGYLDLLVAGAGNGTNIARIYRNLGNGTFADIGAGLPELNYASAVWADYDNDGYLDLAISGSSSTPYLTRIYHNNGNGTFSNSGIVLPQVEGGNVAWGDYDNDGKPDLLLTGFISGGAYAGVYHNNGDGTFSDSGVALPGVNNSFAAWGDYDNDGNLDLVLSGFSPAESRAITRLYRNNGNGTFTDTGVALPGVYTSSLAWGDYDNDGRLDLLLCGLWANGGDITRIYHNNGDGTFTDLNAGLLGIERGAVAWGDYDNDGRLDVLLTGAYNGGNLATRIYHNNGDGTFTDANAGLPKAGYGCGAWADHENDGRLDFLLNGYMSGPGLITRLLGSLQPLTNTVPTAPANLSTTVSNGLVTLRWDAASDSQTAPAGLSYNLRIGSRPGADDILSGMADQATGRRGVASIGNTGLNRSWTIRGLPNGTYYWSVQAVDTAFAGGPWAEERSVSLSSFTLTASAGEHGTISPAGLVTVPAGGATHFTITPDVYYHVANVTTNGVSVGAVTSFLWNQVGADGAIHAAFAPDAAARGTPHWWLAQHGLTDHFDAAETTDSDGDGSPNWQEYVADTNPTNAASIFHILRVVNSPQPAITFLSSSNRLYSLYRCADLAGNTWTLVAGQAEVRGTGAEMTLLDPSSPPAQAYYRIDVRTP